MNFKISLIIIALIITYSANSTAENIVNMISCEDYKAITYNGKTIEEINATNAEPQQVQQLWGTYSTFDEISDNRSRSFHYGENRVGFSYGNVSYVTRITITNNQWPVIIKGKTVRVGDSVSSLQQKFGTNLIIAQSQYRARTFVAFGCTEKDEGVDLEIDPHTNKVKEIVYFVSP